MKYRKYTAEDFDLVETFLKGCHYEGGVTKSGLEQRTSILNFDEEEKFVGFAMQWRNNLHDRTITVEICIHPEKRRKGLGTSLFNHLFQEFPIKENDFAIDIMCSNGNIAAQNFSESIGLENYLICHNNIFKIKDLPLVESDLEFVKLSEFFKVPKNRERVKVFHCSQYDRDHEPFVPVTKNKEVRYDYYREGDHEFGVVLLKENDIVGCSLAYMNFECELDRDIHDVTCLHGYAIGETLEEEAERVQALYSYQAKLLKDENHKNIYLEFDSIENISKLMLEWIPYTAKPLLRFQKRL
mgnify:CR=1 FL=1|tara:strand:+ start:153373 stop:154266 length:894 start_codon:yes stop_codon:yes gene_type:complete